MKLALTLCCFATAVAGVCCLLGSFKYAPADKPLPRARSAAYVRPLRPNLVVEQSRYKFGTMDVGERGEHWFELRNHGDGELTLELGESSCACTEARLEALNVAPGGSTRVRVTWTPPKPALFFSQGVTIRTNDKARKELRLSVVGKVRAYAAVSPEALVFSEVRRDEPATQTVTLYSQVVDGLPVASIESSIPQLSAVVQPVPAEALQELESTAGLQLAVALAPGLPPGPFSATLRIRLNLPEDCDPKMPREIELPVSGAVVGNVSLYGPSLDGYRRLDLGVLSPGEGARTRLMLLARGPDRDLTISRIETTPPFLEVEVLDNNASSEAVSLHTIEVRVPRDAPTANHLGPKAGHVRLFTDHTEAPEFRIHVNFAVSPPG